MGKPPTAPVPYRKKKQAFDQRSITVVISNASEAEAGEISAGHVILIVMEAGIEFVLIVVVAWYPPAGGELVRQPSSLKYVTWAPAAEKRIAY